MAIKKGTILETAFDRFVVEKQIGQGGNGRVFKAKNNKNEMKAIKILDKGEKSNEKIKRFKNEVFFCMKNEHKNIIKIEDYGFYKDGEKEYIFYIMPYYDETLRNRMNNSISSKNIIEIFCSILDGLEFAHENGVIHRDIKPENILLNKDSNQAVIADFGIAHIMKEENMATVVETKFDERVGNRDYCSPEQKDKTSEVSAKTDIFSLGLLLNEMFTQKIPAGVNYKKIEDVDDDLGFLDDIVDMMICQNPDDRLFPENRIKVELRVRRERKESKQKIDSLENIRIHQSSDRPIQSPKLIDYDFEDNELTLVLSEKMSMLWGDILVNGSYSYTHLAKYPKHVFKANGDMVKVNIHPSDNEETVKKVVEHFIQWLPTVTEEYNTIMKKQKEKQQREAEEKRKRDIEIEQRETKVKETLKDLI